MTLKETWKQKEKKERMLNDIKRDWRKKKTPQKKTGLTKMEQVCERAFTSIKIIISVDPIFYSYTPATLYRSIHWFSVLCSAFLIVLVEMQFLHCGLMERQISTPGRGDERKRERPRFVTAHEKIRLKMQPCTMACPYLYIKVKSVSYFLLK